MHGVAGPESCSRSTIVLAYIKSTKRVRKGSPGCGWKVMASTTDNGQDVPWELLYRCDHQQRCWDGGTPAGDWKDMASAVDDGS